MHLVVRLNAREGRAEGNGGRDCDVVGRAHDECSQRSCVSEWAAAAASAAIARGARGARSRSRGAAAFWAGGGLGTDGTRSRRARAPQRQIVGVSTDRRRARRHGRDRLFAGAGEGSRALLLLLRRSWPRRAHPNHEEHRPKRPASVAHAESAPNCHRAP